jgi:Magnesium chelatase, subunit ChlI C-terminal
MASPQARAWRWPRCSPPGERYCRTRPRPCGSPVGRPDTVRRQHRHQGRGRPVHDRPGPARRSTTRQGPSRRDELAGPLLAACEDCPGCLSRWATPRSCWKAPSGSRPRPLVPLERAVDRGQSSARGADRIIRMAWTLADLARPGPAAARRDRHSAWPVARHRALTAEAETASQGPRSAATPHPTGPVAGPVVAAFAVSP